MKKRWTFLVLILCCIFFGSCGDYENMESQTFEENAKYLDIVVESGQKMGMGQDDGQRLSIQFYQNSPVQLFARMKTSVESGTTTDIYVKKMDGSSEILLQNTPWVGDFGFAGVDGCFYSWDLKRFKKINQSGEVVFELSLETLNLGVRDICQLEDGTIYLIIFDYTNGIDTNGTKVAKMDAATGEITQINTISRVDLGSISKGGIAAGQDGLMTMTAEGIWLVDVEDGSKESVFSFVGSSYILQPEISVEDFRVTEEGKLEILRANGSVEELQRADVSIEHTPITIRGIHVTNNLIGNWLKERIAEFNQENETYYVVLEECDSGTEPEDYARLTSVEISTGKGPDILYGPILEEYISGMIEKGAFEDFRPYMESYGIREEDYFPCAFNCWRDGEKIYGINFYTKLINFHMDEAVLGGREVPNIDTLVSSLLTWQEKSVFIEGYDSADVLEYFLEGSDELWGMIDWGTSTCDFGGKLFANMLEVAKRYGDDETNNYDAVAFRRLCEGFYAFESEANQISTGKVSSGVLFDAGCYGAVLADWTLAVNANSEHKEGAWEFIAYLLSEEAQVEFVLNVLPVHRRAFQTLADEAPDPNIIITRNGVEIEKANESEVAEMIEIIENAKPLPIRTVPILDIICEESEDYFNGTKSIEEVVAVIENRVQLYLEEN